MYSQAQVTTALIFFSASIGVIYTAGILDCETKDSYWLTVYATDKGVTPLSASIEVFIQVSTHCCQYSHYTMHAKEALYRGDVL